MPTLRFAVPEDAPALLAIYRQSIDTPITFEGRTPTAEEFAARMAGIGQRYPYLVAEEDGRPVGYAYSHAYRQREAYQWSAELSVYVEKSCQGRGIGRQLYGALIRLARLQKLENLYAWVTVPNRQSEGLHRVMGFKEVGVDRRAGFKAGRWQAVAIYVLRLGEDQPPRPFRPIGALPQEEALQALQEA